jgi:hypothetical protein
LKTLGGYEEEIFVLENRAMQSSDTAKSTFSMRFFDDFCCREQVPLFPYSEENREQNVCTYVPDPRELKPEQRNLPPF